MALEHVFPACLVQSRAYFIVEPFNADMKLAAIKQAFHDTILTRTKSHYEDQVMELNTDETFLLQGRARGDAALDTIKCSNYSAAKSLALLLTSLRISCTLLAEATSLKDFVR